MHLISTCKHVGQIAFTFDDGVSNNFETLLKILDQEKVIATFFIIGNTLLDSHKFGMAKDAYKAGHILGNHTWSHCNALKVTPEQLSKELDDTEAMLRKVQDGAETVKFYRPPFGAIDQSVYDHVAAKGYKVFYWNLDLNDWNVHIPKDKLLADYKDFFNKADPKKHSYISLQHDMRIHSVELVPEILRMVRDKGFEIVTTKDCI